MQPMPVNREVLAMTKERPILFSGPMVRAILEGRKTQTRRILKHDTQSPLTDKFGPMKETCDPGYWVGCDIHGTAAFARCPYGVPGDRLWVRETWTLGDTDTESWAEVYFRADGEDGKAHRFSVGEEVAERHAAERERLEVAGDGGSNWKPSIHMPRWASRLTLEVKAVRVEQLQEISEADAIAEGATRREIHGHSAGWSMDWSRVGQLSRFAGGIHQRGNEQPLTDRDVCLGSARMAFGALWNSINGKRGRGWEANPFVWVVKFERVTP